VETVGENMFRTLLAAVVSLLAVHTLAHAQAPSAADFAREPAMWSPSLSPDGRLVAAIQSVEQGHALVIIDWRTRQATAIQIARRDRSMYLESVAWKNDRRLIFVVRQRVTMHYSGTGSRNRQAPSEEYDVYRIFAIDMDGANTVQLFESQSNRLAWRDASIRLIDRLENDPDNVMIGTWSQRGFTLYRADVNTGRAQSVEDADWQTANLIVDRNGRPVMRMDVLPYASGYRIYRRGPSQRSWTVAHEVRRTQRSENRTFRPLGAGPGPGQVYVAARPHGQEFQAIYLYDTATGELGEPVFRHERADAAIAWINPHDNALLVGCGEAQRWECRATDPALQRHFDALSRYFEQQADFNLNGVSSDGRYWLLYAVGPTVPGTYYIYDLSTNQVSIIASTQPQIPRAQLAPTRFESYVARDGANLWGYLTTPTTGAAPFPTVILPHGGPAARDSFSYDFIVQYLVSRGYAVFQPNFRGSEGSGRSFAEAGWRQWGGLMQNDITDGVRHLAQAGIADANRICIVGISYGGYAALAGAALTPELYQCAVSIAGLSDLPELLETERSDAGRRSALYASVVQQIGDPNDDRDALIAASPRRHVERITAPILLIHGAWDDVALASQSERMHEALQAAGKSSRYIEIESAYHPWDSWTTTDARLLLEETERFLAEHLSE